MRGPHFSGLINLLGPFTHHLFFIICTCPSAWASLMVCSHFLQVWLKSLSLRPAAVFSDTKCLSFPTPAHQFWYWLSSVIIRLHRFTGSVLSSDATTSPRRHLHFWLISYKLERSHKPLLRFDHFQRDSQSSGNCFTYIYWFIVKDAAQNRPMEDTHGARSGAGGCEYPGVPSPQHITVFTNPSLRGFYSGSLWRHD